MSNSVPSCWPAGAELSFIAAFSTDPNVQDLEDRGTKSSLLTGLESDETTVLASYGCLNVQRASPTLMPTDDSVIHPLFARKNWDTPGIATSLVDSAFKEMRLALALATKLITHEETLGWWIHTFYGREHVESEKNNKRYLPEDKSETNLQKARQEVADKFNQLASELRFYWLPNPETPGIGGMYSSNPYRVLSNIDDNQPGPVDPEFAPVIGISTLMLHHLLSPAGAQRSTESNRLRFQLFLAKIIVHEVAHAWVDFNHDYPAEPYIYLDDYMPEAGFSYEDWLLGSELVPRPFDRSTFGPLCSLTLPEMHAFPTIWVPQTMDWVVKWFSPKTWDNLGQPIRKHLRPKLVPELGKWYSGVFFAHRFNREANVWMRALYANGQLKATRALHIPGSPEPNKSQLRSQRTPMEHWKTVGAWYEDERKRDIRLAKGKRWPEGIFKHSRDELYQQYCYDGAGD